MTGIAQRSLAVREQFVLEPDFDVETNCLTFTSAPTATTDTAGAADESALRTAIEAGRVSIVWNHAPIGQYVTLKIPGTSHDLGFDVGRYDAFGVYRFERLAALSSTSPNLLIDALTPLVRAGNGRTSK